MLRSSSPTLSQLRAIDVTRIGQSVCESIHARTRSAMSDCRMKRWRVARTSSRVLPEIGGPWVDQVRRFEQARAVLALVAVGALVAAVRAGADDVAVGEEALVVERIDLVGDPLLDHAVVAEPLREVPGELGVLRRRAAPEVVERQAETPGEVCLDLVLLGAVVGDAQSGRGGGEFGRRAVLVGRADEEDVVPAQAHGGARTRPRAASSRPGCRGA